MPIQRTAKARLYVERVWPVALPQISANCAGEALFYRRGVVSRLMALAVRAAADWWC